MIDVPLGLQLDIPLGAQAELTWTDRSIDEPGVLCWARISPDGRFRYELGRCWDITALFCTFIMLNPSTADAFKPDPTLKKCCGFARRWGFGGVVIGNLWPYRTKDPKVLARAARNGVDITGNPEGDQWLERMLGKAGTIIIAWGGSLPKLPGNQLVERISYVNGLAARQPNEQRNLRLAYLGKTKDGQPRHPLMLAYDTKVCEVLV